MLTIISGCSGSGKTTIINELKSRSYQIMEEVATRLWNEYKSWEILHFAETVLDIQIQELVEHKSTEICFTDRSIIDTFAYLWKLPSCGIINFEKYNRKVFFMEGLLDETITVRRPDSIENRIQLGEKIKNLYIKNGFEIILVPKMDIKSRADFILCRLKNG